MELPTKHPSTHLQGDHCVWAVDGLGVGQGILFWIRAVAGRRRLIDELQQVGGEYARYGRGLPACLSAPSDGVRWREQHSRAVLNMVVGMAVQACGGCRAPHAVAPRACWLRPSRLPPSLRTDEGQGEDAAMLSHIASFFPTPLSLPSLFPRSSPNRDIYRAAIVAGVVDYWISALVAAAQERVTAAVKEARGNAQAGVHWRV